MAITIEQARTAKQGVIDDVLATEPLHGLAVGTGIGRQGEDYCVAVNLRESLPEGVDIPSEYGGVPIKYTVTGQPQASDWLVTMDF